VLYENEIKPEAE